MKKVTNPSVRSLRDLAEHFGIVDKSKPLKYTDFELCDLLIKYVEAKDARIEGAKRQYRRDQEELKKLRNPQLWAFGTFNTAPPQYRQEYLKRLKEGDDGKERKYVLTKTDILKEE